MTKIAKINIILIIAIFTIMTNVYASSCIVNISTQNKNVSKDEQFVINVSLSNIEDEKGIIAFAGVLEYDKNSLTLLDIEGEGEWAKPTYNEKNGKFVMERDDYATSNEIVCKITFKVNEQSVKNPMIKLRNIEVSNGKIDIALEDTTLFVTVESETTNQNPGSDQEPNPDTNPNINQNTTPGTDPTPNQKPNTNPDSDRNQNPNLNTGSTPRPLPDTDGEHQGETIDNNTEQKPNQIPTTNSNQNITSNQKLPSTEKDKSSIFIILIVLFAIGLIAYFIRILAKSDNNKRK